MDTISVYVQRYSSGIDAVPHWEKFEVPHEEKNTVLGALLYIRENLDSTLAFRYSCRNKACGLCAMSVNGEPVLACKTYVSDGMRIGSLENIAVIKDLVADRGSIMKLMSEYKVYLNGDGSDRDTAVVEPKINALFRKCKECMICVSQCPYYENGIGRSAGPMIFVKMARLLLDPRDSADRRADAIRAGIDYCVGCNKCSCIDGVPIQKGIELLLGSSE